MSSILRQDQIRDLTARGFTRRNFGRIAAVLTAGASMPFYNEAALAQFTGEEIPSEAVRINLNENPLGPCKEAIEAMCKVVPKGGRYLQETTAEFVNTFAECEGVKRGCVAGFAGSSTALHHAIIAFTGPNRPLVIADPGYDAPLRSAEFIGAKVIKIPLARDYAHDVKAMAAAASRENAGLVFLCNPNNPTGTVTSKSDIDWIVANIPKDTILLLDEAYLQYTEATPGTYLVNQDKNVIVLRTFSKLYGMAGLRAGVAIARPGLLQKIRSYSYGPLPATSMAGAAASLKVENLVTERRRLMRDLREDVFSFLEKHRFDFVRSAASMFMVDVKRPGAEIMEAMRKQNVYIGRVWPVWPTHVRVSIGTQEDMDRFKAAFLKAMAS